MPMVHTNDDTTHPLIVHVDYHSPLGLNQSDIEMTLPVLQLYVN